MSGATFDRAQHEWKQAASVEAELLKRVEAAEAERNRLRAELAHWVRLRAAAADAAGRPRAKVVT
jgi:hypothetical protein